MMTHFYLSSRFSNRTNVKKVATDLLNLNFSQTYDWTKISQVTSMEQLKTIGKEEVKGIQVADFLVFIDTGREKQPRGNGNSACLKSKSLCSFLR